MAELGAQTRQASRGMLYPHHNLYYITAADWDLKALVTFQLYGLSGAVGLVGGLF